jgi:hypothetical protein
MKLIAGGGVNCWTENTTHIGGVATVRFGGVVIDRSIADFWRTAPAAGAYLFDYRAAIIAYRTAIYLPSINTQREGPPGAILCGQDNYDLFLKRADDLAELGIFRKVFLRQEMALDWSRFQARRSLAKLAPRRRARDAFPTPNQ